MLIEFYHYRSNNFMIKTINVSFHLRFFANFHNKSISARPIGSSSPQENLVVLLNIIKITESPGYLH